MLSLAEQWRALDAGALCRGAAMCFGFVVALLLASMLLPGRRERGATLEDGRRLEYKLNGLGILLLLVAAVAGFTALGGSLAGIQRQFLAIGIAANALAFGLTFALWLVGRDRPGSRSHGPGAWGFLRDVYYGVELDPRFCGVDLKMFSYKPSLMGLGLVNASFAYAQYETYGRLGQAMLLYQGTTFVYVLNYFQFEHGMLFTWDVMSERFGWMLVWGDYAFVPFCYSIAGWYLVDRLEPLPVPFLIGLPLLFAFGLWVFRGANDQKDRFKRDPGARIWGKPAETIGGRILVSGFWGIGRKLNYTGEICVYLSWTLLTGFGSIVPWLLPLWLVGLLSHRAWRDDKRCREKYGEVWDAYCRRARFKMIPFLY